MTFSNHFACQEWRTSFQGEIVSWWGSWSSFRVRNALNCACGASDSQTQCKFTRARCIRGVQRVGWGARCTGVSGPKFAGKCVNSPPLRTNLQVGSHPPLVLGFWKINMMGSWQFALEKSPPLNVKIAVGFEWKNCSKGFKTECNQGCFPFPNSPLFFPIIPSFILHYNPSNPSPIIFPIIFPLLYNTFSKIFIFLPFPKSLVFISKIP